MAPLSDDPLAGVPDELQLSWENLDTKYDMDFLRAMSVQNPPIPIYTPMSSLPSSLSRPSYPCCNGCGELVKCNIKCPESYPHCKGCGERVLCSLECPESNPRCNGCGERGMCHWECPELLKAQVLAWLAEFKFTDLPKECQMMILKEAFTSEDGGFLCKERKQHSTQLLRVCKEWHEYGKNAVYAGNVFKFDALRRDTCQILPANFISTLTSDSMRLIRHVDLYIGIVHTARFKELALFTGLKTLNITDQVRRKASKYEQYADPAFLVTRRDEAVRILSMKSHGVSELNVGRLGAAVKITHTVHRCLPILPTAKFHCRIVWSVSFEEKKLALRLEKVERMRKTPGGKVSEVHNY